MWLDTNCGAPRELPCRLWRLPFASIPSEALPPGLGVPPAPRGVGAGSNRSEGQGVSDALSPAIMFALAALQADGRQGSAFAVEDPPSLTFRFDNGIVASEG